MPDDLPLIAWDEVPEGPVVWCRAAGSSSYWKLGLRRGDTLMILPGRGVVRAAARYEFAAAEQQPGEWAAKVAELTAQRDKWLSVFNRSEQFQNGPTKRAESAEADLARLRDGLAALEQEMAELDAREQIESLKQPSDFWLRAQAALARRVRRSLAALREGQ